MKTKISPIIAGLAIAGLGFMSFTVASLSSSTELEEAAAVAVTPQPIPPFVNNSIDWLAKAQFETGGWGAGLSSAQHIRDPKAVKTDPGTTAFAAMALLRSGNTLKEGQYSANVTKALDYLLTVAESSPEESPYIGDVRGTQPQAKLGQNIDASMMVQFFTRVLPLVEDDAELWGRTQGAMNRCIKKIQGQQQANGSQGGGTWAGALQSSMAMNALEVAQGQGVKVDQNAYKRAVEYNSNYVNTSSGNVDASSAAGVPLYAVSSNQRATAARARKAKLMVEKAKEEGRVEKDAEISEDVIEQAARSQDLSDEEVQDLKQGYVANEASYQQMQNERILSGFGNNGGEEYYSFLQTSEALVITGGDAWEDWQSKMTQRLEKIQNPDGSWNGHHCITSPVFCTAAAIMLLTADRDAEILTAGANN